MGTHPPFGFEAYKVQRGINNRGEPIRKTLWRPATAEIAERSLSAWARTVLVEWRLQQHASLDQIRDRLNAAGIPAVRKRYWGTSSVRALLQPALLLKYAGYEVWNVHDGHGRERPPAEWVIIPNAHPAIITLEEGEAIMAVNDSLRQASQTRTPGRLATVRSQESPFLLSGGLFVCARCGANMVSHRNRGREYYICGSAKYRKGLGCGPARQVRQTEIEGVVVEEIRRLFWAWADQRRLSAALQEAISATQQTRAREQAEITADVTRVDLVLQYGTTAEKRAYLRAFVQQISLDPDTDTVTIALYGDPPHQKAKPASEETGMHIGLVAGAIM